MGELDEWAKAIRNLIRSGGTTTSDTQRKRVKNDRRISRSKRYDDDDWPEWNQSQR